MFRRRDAVATAIPRRAPVGNRVMSEQKDAIPTLYQWADGMPALEKLTEHFHESRSEDAPKPKWGWGVPGGPYAVSARAFALL
jgi:hypothetical protein